MTLCKYHWLGPRNIIICHGNIFSTKVLSLDVIASLESKVMEWIDDDNSRNSKTNERIKTNPFVTAQEAPEVSIVILVLLKSSFY